MRVTAVFTCFNRKEKTEKCITTLTSNNGEINFDFIVVDDRSTDGTIQMLEEQKQFYPIYVIEGTGSSFYSGGMRLGLSHLMNRKKQTDYVLLVNDDVEFVPHSIEKMILRSQSLNNAIIAGATCSSQGKFTYGPLKITNRNMFRYRKLDITETTTCCDSFNGNCVLIPYTHYKKNPVMDAKYIHTLGDYDYGFAFSRLGIPIYVSDEYVGICENNSTKGTWLDCSLSIYERIKKKESVKGAPVRQWWYYLRKNFNWFVAVRYSISPYFRILLRK